MGGFNSNDHYIYYCGQESLKWDSPHSQQEFEMQYLEAISKNDRMISVPFQGKPFH